MKEIKFNDMHGVEVRVQHSSSAVPAYRIYMIGEGFEVEKDNLGREIERCLHINTNQARILIHALEDLIEESE